METLARDVALGFACTASLDFRVLTPPLVNHAENAERMGEGIAMAV
jgi:hypothetical protein